jgi:hypothetical protein
MLSCDTSTALEYILSVGIDSLWSDLFSYIWGNGASGNHFAFVISVKKASAFDILDGVDS